MSDIGDRMKKYERVSQINLMQRAPVIVRLDGKAFHTFTRSMKKPFDSILKETMQQTAKTLCEQIQGCQLAYIQSDEISLLLTDYAKLDTQGWFDYKLQKMTSISSAIASVAFNAHFIDLVYQLPTKEQEIYKKKFNKAIFDSRAFNVPKEDVCNYFIWRQQDAIRNSINAMGQSVFTTKQMHCKNTKEVLKMLKEKQNIHWDQIPITDQQGSCVKKIKVEVVNMMRDKFVIDNHIPKFSEQRSYIEELI